MRRAARSLPLFLLPLLLLGACELAPLRVVPEERAIVHDAPELPAIPAPSAAAAEAPAGFAVEVVASGLTYPTSLEIDDEGALWIAEAGYVYGDVAAPTRLLRVAGDAVEVAVEEGLLGPVNDLLWHDGRLLVSHRGKISVVEDEGLRDLVTGLPSAGDHHNNQLAAGPDGWIYFGQGTATNSGVVGIDNWEFGWLKLQPGFHDVPGGELRLRGVELVTLDPFVMTRPGEGPLARTGAFAPFGKQAGEGVAAAAKPTGAVLRFRPEDPEGTLEVFAWGLRNPFGVAVDGERVYVAENGFDDRGSRPVANAPDVLWEVERGGWYGWPDFAAGERIDQERFRPEGKEAPELLLAEHPPVAGAPLATFPPHTSVAKLAVAPAEGPLADLAGRIVVAEFGDMAPLTGTVEAPMGHRVVVVDPATGDRRTLLRARAEALGEGLFHHVATAGPRRPIDVVFARDGSALYVVDLGAVVVLPTAAPVPRPFVRTGAVWRLAPSDGLELPRAAAVRAERELSARR